MNNGLLHAGIVAALAGRMPAGAGRRADERHVRSRSRWSAAPAPNCPRRPRIGRTRSPRTPAITIDECLPPS